MRSCTPQEEEEEEEMLLVELGEAGFFSEPECWGLGLMLPLCLGMESRVESDFIWSVREARQQ